jgi:hypothetical protein
MIKPITTIPIKNQYKKNTIFLNNPSLKTNKEQIIIINIINEKRKHTTSPEGIKPVIEPRIPAHNNTT